MSIIPMGPTGPDLYYSGVVNYFNSQHFRG